MKKLLLAAGMLLGTACAQAQTFPASWSGRFQTVMDSLTHQTSLLTTNGDTVGISVAINMPGVGTWAGASGPARPGTRLTSAMPMGIGSCSKLYMAVMLLKLQEQGVLDLDDPIGKWLPYAPHDIDTSATIRQCLQHEAGFFDVYNDRPTWVNDLFADTSAVWTYERIIDSVGAPHFSPGKGYYYSNTGYLLCGWIIERASGQSLGYNLHHSITTPLGLTRTYDAFYDTAALRLVVQSSAEVWGTWYYGLGSKALASMTRGEGGLMVTPADLARFYQAIFSDSSTFLSPQSRRELLDVDAASQYGLGIVTSYGSVSHATINIHTGAQSGYLTEAFYDRSTGASVVIVTNSLDADQSTFTHPLIVVSRDDRPRQAADGGIAAIRAPQGTVCSGTVVPVVTLTNYGSAPLTSATIGYQIGTGAALTLAWTGSLAPGASADVTLPAGTAANGLQQLKAWSAAANGSPEVYRFNDTLRTTFRAALTAPATTYLHETFDGASHTALLWNADNLSSGQFGITKLGGTSGTRSLACPNWSTPLAGRASNIDMPLVHLAPGSSPVLSFNYAYMDAAGSADSLEALVSTNCGATWTSLFHKGGAALSNGQSTSDRYFPMLFSAPWHTVSLPLSAYSGDVLVRLRQVNDWGNNLYIDDIVVGAPTGLGEAALQTALQVYPNPTTDQVTVSGLPEQASVAVSDVAGKKLLQATVTGGSATLNLGALAPGMYLVNTPLGTRKLLKK